MEIKSKPNQERYYEVLRSMTPAQRLSKAIELSELGKRLLKHGLKKRFPDATPEELHEIFLNRLKQCHNRNY